jgi:ATP adenylyltransferase
MILEKPLKVEYAQMNRMENCCLCNIALGQRKYGDIDAPFLESDNFMAIASIGSFIAGWTLIVPKSHSLSCSSFFEDQEFLEFSIKTKKHVESIFGNVVMFEHGAGKAGSLIGCGVDHAHLHIVPHPASLEENLKQDSLDWQSCSGSELQRLSPQSDYLFYVKSITESQIQGIYSRPKKPESQYFRKKLGGLMGFSETSDYKRFLHQESSLRSRNLLSAAQ